MFFFKNLYRQFRKEQEAKSPSTSIELIADELSVHVAVHPLPLSMGNSNQNALSFLTKGMQKQGQQELFFVLKTNQINLEEIPPEPLYFFQQVYKLAQQGQLAKEGSVTQFGEKDLWGWKGIVYTKAPNHLTNLPSDCLCMVLLSLEEVQSVQAFGYTRILSMLGKQTRYYPFPYWTDHYRENILTKELSKSILHKVRRMTLPEATVTLSNNKHLHLAIHKTVDLNLTEENFPSTVPLALLPSLSLEADSALTWPMAGDIPEAITLPNSAGKKMGGSFLLILGDQETNLAKIAEDGFLLMLTDEQWNLFWKAVQEKTTYVIKTGDNFLDFSLVWV